ncbi:MAG: glycosyltransferase [Clostridia bacterium]|nr:glycosyltransferase [Clostridia bacterium]
MKFIMASSGSLGDVFPYIALAIGLRKQGHEVVFALPNHLAPLPMQHGFESVQLGPDMQETVLHYQVLMTEGNLTQKDILKRNKFLAEIAPQIIQKLRSLCRRADALIGLYNTPFLPIIHEKTGIPIISIRVSYPGFEDPSINVFGANSLPSDRPANNEIKKHLILNAISRELLADTIEKYPNQHVTGFFFVEEETQPKPGLVSFIESGAPPVVITLGSTKHQNPRELSELFERAIRNAGYRAVIQYGWSGLGKDLAFSEHIYSCDYAPHRWLFPRAACVVHHGGAGTTAASLYSGTPAIIIPHCNDQFIIADKVKDLHCIGPIIPYRELTASKLEFALREVIENTRYKKAAEEISKRIQSENGVEKACSLITDFLA